MVPVPHLTMSKYITNIFQESLDSLLIAEKQIREKGHVQTSGYVRLEDFWKEIDLVSRCLSHECTKLCISFSNIPFPSADEASSLLIGIEKNITGLISCIYKLEIKWGEALHSEVAHACISAIQATRQLIQTIKDEEGIGINPDYKLATGVVWEGCKSLITCLRDNLSVVISALRKQNSLICDAFEEISEAMEGDGSGWNTLDLGSSESESDEPKWSEEDKRFILPSVNLIKAAKLLYKRIVTAIEKNGKCGSLDHIKELDLILHDCKPISDSIDDLVMELYPPVDAENIHTQSHILAENIITSLKSGARCHFVTESEKDGLEFIQQAVDHNLQNLKNLRKLLNND